MAHRALTLLICLHGVACGDACCNYFPSVTYLLPFMGLHRSGELSRVGGVCGSEEEALAHNEKAPCIYDAPEWSFSAVRPDTCGTVRPDGELILSGI